MHASGLLQAQAVTLAAQGKARFACALSDAPFAGIALAAGPGTSVCYPNGTLAPAVADVAKGAFNTSFVVLGLQCVHKGMIK